MRLNSTIPDAIRSALDEIAAATGLDPRAHRLVVGVSGGPDSLALLHGLLGLLEPERLIVAHLDHALRPTSAADAAAVAELAAPLGLSFAAARIDVAELARAEGRSLEEAGRVARYRFLAAVARDHNAPAVAVGHNADDQAEAVLMHLLRGSGLAGLRGMVIDSPMPEEPTLRLLRPLLRVSRAAIERYVADHDLRPIHDETNLDTTFFRNRLRHEVLPLLEQVSPRARERLTTLADIVAADDALLRQLEEEAYGSLAAATGNGWVALDRPGWLAQPLALRRRLLRLALSRCLPGLRDAGFESLEAARHLAEAPASGGVASLPGGARLIITHQQLLVSAPGIVPPPTGPQLPNDTPLRLSVPGAVNLGNGWVLSADWQDPVDLAPILAENDPWQACIAASHADSLVVRPRLPGERFQPFGLHGRETSIKEWMIDSKLPAAERARWPIVAGTDHCLWIVGQVVDYRGRVSAEDARMIRLSCRPSRRLTAPQPDSIL